MYEEEDEHEDIEFVEEEEDPAFDFGSWCPVCDRAISPLPHPPPSLVTPHGEITQAVVTTLSQSSKSTKGGTGKRNVGALGSRRKSMTRLNHLVGGAKNSRSHGNLHALASSTAIHSTIATNKEKEKGKEKPKEKEKEKEEVLLDLIPPSSLYCSEECRRIDEMRSRLAIAHLVPTNTSPNYRSLLAGGGGSIQGRESTGSARRYSESNESSEGGPFSMSRDRNSNTSYSQSQSQSYSQASGSSYGNSHFGRRTSSASNYPPLYARNDSSSNLALQNIPPLLSSIPNNGNVGNLPTLDFSTRRNSRGSNSTEGSYPYNRESSSRRSTDSLTSLDSEGERERGYLGSLRPPSALSSLRFMTPILPPSSSSTTTSNITSSTINPSLNTTTRRPPSLIRHHTDAPKPLNSGSGSGIGSGSMRRGSSSANGREPPLSSPKRVGFGLSAGGSGSAGARRGTESDPGRVTSIMMQQSQSTTSINSSSTSSPPPPSLSQFPPSSSSYISSSTLLQNQTQTQNQSPNPPKRTNSSASLALMSDSFDSRSTGPSWSTGMSGGPKRSESTTSLSGLIAVGTMSLGGSGGGSGAGGGLGTVMQSKDTPMSDFSSPSTETRERERGNRRRERSRVRYGNGNRNEEEENEQEQEEEQEGFGSLTDRSVRSMSRKSPIAGKFGTLRGNRSTTSLVSSGYSGSCTDSMNGNGNTLAPSSSSFSPDSIATPTQDYQNQNQDQYKNARSLSNLEGILKEGEDWNGIEGIVKIRSRQPRFALTGDSNGTIKKRSKASRAMSTPSTARRPNFSMTESNSRSRSPPEPTSPTSPQSFNRNGNQLIKLNPKLSHLHSPPPSLSSDSSDYSYSNSTTSNSNSNSNGLKLVNTDQKVRKWSWDHLHIPTYPILDIDRVRREKLDRERMEAGLGREGEEGNEKLGGRREEMVMPPVVKERKRLFYFSEAGDHD